MVAPCDQLVSGFNVLHAAPASTVEITANLYVAEANGSPQLTPARSARLPYGQTDPRTR